MVRTTNKLDARTVATRRKTGYHNDGHGLYLQVSKSGTKNWVFRFKLNGRAREMGLGAVHTVTLAEAREKAREARKLVADGIDPIEHRRSEKAARALAQRTAKTFDECADLYIEGHKAGWKNAKHAAQWKSTLKTYATPAFGSLPVSEIDTSLVLRALQPIWTTKAETASRLRGRIETILSWAATHGYRQGENPARWRGHLDNLLPKSARVAKVQHHPALPYREAGAFLKELRTQEGTAARALELLILTATRTSEVIHSTWGEFDLENKTWTIPSDRMKARVEHQVPLSAPAVALLKELQKGSSTGYVFPGVRENKPLSNMAMLAVLKRMERADLTVHGFRSTFRDWAAETTSYPHEVAEMALAHIIGNKAEAAYRRGKLLPKRRSMMAEWATYCSRV